MKIKISIINAGMKIKTSKLITFRKRSDLLVFLRGSREKFVSYSIRWQIGEKLEMISRIKFGRALKNQEKITSFNHKTDDAVYLIFTMPLKKINKYE